MYVAVVLEKITTYDEVELPALSHMNIEESYSSREIVLQILHADPPSAGPLVCNFRFIQGKPWPPSCTSASH
jgi:hypothetical protein